VEGDLRSADAGDTHPLREAQHRLFLVVLRANAFLLRGHFDQKAIPSRKHPWDPSSAFRYDGLLVDPSLAQLRGQMLQSAFHKL
jgi:hypothetical protein